MLNYIEDHNGKQVANKRKEFEKQGTRDAGRPFKVCQLYANPLVTKIENTYEDNSHKDINYLKEQHWATTNYSKDVLEIERV